MPLPAGKQGLFHGLLSLRHPSAVSPNPSLLHYWQLPRILVLPLIFLSLTPLSVYTGEKYFVAVVAILSIPCLCVNASISSQLISTNFQGTHVYNTHT